MWSIWNAPSDRDYREQFNSQAPEPEERCWGCGASENEACEEWCETNRPAEPECGEIEEA